MIRPVALALVALAASGGVAVAQSTWSLVLEGGAEYDSNPRRFEVPEGSGDIVDGGPLLRLGARYRGRFAPAERQRLSLSAFGGNKTFLSDAGQGEDVAIVAGNGRYDIGLAKRRSILSVRGSYYNAVGDGGGRNFSSTDGSAALSLVGTDGHRITGHVGYRLFRYKADERFDFDGDHYGVRYATTLWQGDDSADSGQDPTSVDVAMQYRFERRRYDGVAFTTACDDDAEPMPECFVPTALSRVDANHTAIAEVAYTGERIYSARYELQANDSNSEGQSLVRHRIELGFTTESLARILLTAKLVAQYNVFLDPLLLARDVQAQSFVTIDDENRNAVILHATRDLSEQWSGEARYGLFTNEFATQELSFRRHTGYLGIVYRYR